MKDILQYIVVPIVTALITAVITYLSTKVNNKTKMELAIKDHEIKLQELNNEMLSKEKNCNVQIFEMASMFATGSGTIAELMAELQEFHVTINLNAKVTKVTKDHIEYVQEGEIKQFNCNHVVASLGVKPFGLELVKEIKTAGYPTIVIGDASGEAKISGAVLSGYNASHSI